MLTFNALAMHAEAEAGVRLRSGTTTCDRSRDDAAIKNGCYASKKTDDERRSFNNAKSILIKAIIGHMDNALIHISRHAIMQNPAAGAAKKLS